MSRQPELPTLLSIDGFEACILVDGKEVPHYGIEHNEAKREISCWVASEAGKPFAYQYTKIGTEYDCSIGAYLDGKPVESTVIKKEKGPNIKRTRTSVRISRTESRNFMFGCLQLTDDDTYLENSSSQQNLGDIKIVFKQTEILKVNPFTTRERYVRLGDETQRVLHERSKKALSHQVSYGESVPSICPERTYEVKNGRALATFNFKYRPLAMLQANGIAPPDPIISPQQEESARHTTSPPNKKRKHSEVKQEIDEDVDKERANMEARERALLAELEKVRQEKLAWNDGQGSGRAKRVKQEPQTCFAPGEIIDLT